MLGYLNLPGPGRIPLEGLQSDPLWLQQHANSGVEPFSFSIQQVEDPPHEEATIAIQIGPAVVPGGPHPMNGFVDSYLIRQPPPSDKGLVMGHYMAPEVPVFDFLARHYTVCDRWSIERDTKGAKTRFIAPAYGKFESSSLQRRVNKLSVPLEMMLVEGSKRRARTDWPSGGIARRNAHFWMVWSPGEARQQSVSASKRISTLEPVMSAFNLCTQMGNRYRITMR
jgi:hypothetical protein